MAFRAVKRPDDPQWRALAGNLAGPEMLARFTNPNKGTPTRASDGHALPVVAYTMLPNLTCARGDLLRQAAAEGELGGIPGAAIGQVLKKTAHQSGIGIALEPTTNGYTTVTNSRDVLVVMFQYTDTQRTNKTIKTQFAATDVNGAIPTSSDVGTQCGWATSGGVWYIDITDTVNTDVEVLAVDTIRNEYIVEVVDALIQS